MDDENEAYLIRLEVKRRKSNKNIKFKQYNFIIK
tara:strand:+ start:602 stop:703 length:102 start_codon:yes stop_codon:yes gene_type:complete